MRRTVLRYAPARRAIDLWPIEVAALGKYSDASDPHFQKFLTYYANFPNLMQFRLGRLSESGIDEIAGGPTWPKDSAADHVLIGCRLWPETGYMTCMCGRFGIGLGPNEISHAFARYKNLFDGHPRYNVAPTQKIAIVKSDGRDEVTGARWGLIPSWSREENPKIQPINAKLETLTESRLFAPLLKHKRCIILADGFYEWRKDGKNKIPVHFRLKSGKPFVFAGLWDEWHHELTTCTLITGEPNELVAPIHNRMPMMISLDRAHDWIEEKASIGSLISMLGPYPADEMDAYDVSPQMNKPSFDKPEAREPAS